MISVYWYCMMCLLHYRGNDDSSVRVFVIVNVIVWVCIKFYILDLQVELGIYSIRKNKLNSDVFQKIQNGDELLLFKKSKLFRSENNSRIIIVQST